MEARTPKTIGEVANILGRRTIATAVGVGLTAVSNAVVREERFPASWYLVLAKLASEAGFKLAPELCGMKSANATNIPQPVDKISGTVT